MKTQDSSDSFDSDDIDLDEIAKMIDPLDDLEKNLFSVKPAENPTRTTRIPSPKKESLHGDKEEVRGDDEAEVLTSYSSNNGQGKSEGLDKSWSKNLERDGTVGSGGKFNAPARARRRNAKLGNGVEGITTSEVDTEFLMSSNLETGLWSGDDLWKLNGDKVLEPPDTSKATLMPGLKSPRGDSKEKTASISTKTKVDNKAGKFDWLGLLDDESEEEKNKGASAESNDQKVSIGSSAAKDFHSHERLERVDVNSSTIDHEHSRVRKGSFGLSKEAKIRENTSYDMEFTGQLNKSSVSEDLSTKKGDLKSSKLERLEFKKLESKSSRTEMTAKDEVKAMKISEVLRGDENDHLNVMGLFNEGAGRAKLRGAAGEENERKEGRPDVPALPRRRSLLVEDERLAQGYAPTFLGGSPEGPSRRRRKREGVEGLPSRPAINSDFDPLGLFSVDELSSKIEDTSKSKVPLPDWLTGSSKKLSTVKESDSHLNLNANVKEVDGHEGRKETERHEDVESHSEKSKEAVSQLSKSSKNILTEAKEMEEKTHDALDSSDFITNIAAEKFYESSRKDDVSSSPIVSHDKEIEEESEKLSRVASDESHNQSPAHAASVTSRKGHTVITNISEVDDMPLKSKEKSPTRVKGMKDDEKSSKKQLKTSSIKSKAKKRVLPRDKVSVEEADLSSPSERTESKSGNAKEFALLERQYGRKVRELEEQAGRAEQLEEELSKMRYLEGEVEHLKAVVHILELEKSAAEALVESLQARHSEQLKRLEDVHRNEVETLRKALLREEKRGAEEVKRLVEDHRKTLDRLMDANIRLEEEFRTRMLEARRDWSRDVEAMRVAYQQSNNAAITNASLAVLTGHSFGAETKDKSEDDIKDDSSAKAVSQCPQEVKELSQTVERVESILTQALKVMLPKSKSQIEEVPDPETEVKVKGPGHVVFGSINKHQGKSLRTKGRQRHAKFLSKKTKDKADKREKAHELSGSSEEEEESIGDRNHGISSSDGVEKLEGILARDTGDKIRRRVLSKDIAEQRKGFCGDCKCCRGHIKGLQWYLGRSVNVQDSHVHWDKCDKEGHNINFRHRGGGEHWRNRKKIFAWKDQMDHENIYGWNEEGRHIQHPEQDHFSMSEGMVLDGNFIPVSKSNAIIDPKAYLLQLASANVHNLFQSSVVTSA